MVCRLGIGSAHSAGSDRLFPSRGLKIARGQTGIEEAMPRVLISDKLEAPGLDVLRQAGIELDERDGLKGDALKDAVRAADGVIVRSQTKITADLLDDPGRLKAVVRAGVGVDNIDVAAATRKG